MKYLLNGEEYKNRIILIREDLWKNKEVWKNKVIGHETFLIQFMCGELPNTLIEQRDWIKARSKWYIDISTSFRLSGYQAHLQGVNNIGVILRTGTDAAYYLFMQEQRKEFNTKKLAVERCAEMLYLCYDGKNDLLEHKIRSYQTELYGQSVHAITNMGLAPNYKRMIKEETEQMIMNLETFKQKLIQR